MRDLQGIPAGRIYKRQLIMKGYYIKLIGICFILAGCQIANGQYGDADSDKNDNSFTWPEGKAMAVSLTFDDARKSQLENGIPILDAAGVKATFYVTIDSLMERAADWKQASNNGHDIGNHNLKHVCSGNFVWSRNQALENYSLLQMEQGLLTASEIIENVVGTFPSSFAYPCGQTFVGRGVNTVSYVPLIASHFESGRNWMAEAPNDPIFCDFSQLTGIKLDGLSFNQVKQLIESKKCAGKWLILAGHDILEDPGDSPLATLASTLDSLCRYARDPANGIWIDNVHQIASYIKKQRDKDSSWVVLPYQNSRLSIDQRIDDLLGRMTLQEKIGQMNMPAAYNRRMYATIPEDEYDLAEGTGWKTQEKDSDLLRKMFICEQFTRGKLIDIGPGGGFFAMANNLFQFEPVKQAKYFNKYQKIAVEETRLGIPLLFSEEGTHGVNKTGATVFPEGLALGSTWNMDLIEEVYTVAAREARSVGIHQLFTLVIEPIRDPRMGRNTEAFSEDPYLVSRIAEAIVRGCQGDDVAQTDRVVAGLAHFPGQSQGVGGLEFGTMEMSERIFRSVFLPPWEAGIKNAGALGVMVTHPVIDAFGGLPATASKRLLTDILRQELDFQGVLLGEGNSIGTILWKKVANSQKEAGIMALNAGLDVAIAYESGYMNDLLESADEGLASLEIIDERVSRVLRQKFRLGLFENPYVDTILAAKVYHTEEHQELALQAAREGIVLLRNENNLLPVSKNLKSIAVIGPNADNARNQLGDYIPKRITHDIVTVLEGIRNAVSPETEVKYLEGCTILDNGRDDIRAASRLAAKSDVAIVVVGEQPGTYGEKSDMAGLDLTGRQSELIKAIHKTGTPTILVLINGRPLSIEWESENIPAILEAWLCGENGGTAIADVIFGNYNPDGRLAISVPRHSGQLPVYYNHSDQKEMRLGMRDDKRAYVDISARPLYDFGYGLSYTQFDYDKLEINPQQTGTAGRIEVSCEVTNIGNVNGNEVVQLYLNDIISSVETPFIELKGFRKVHLDKGETKEVKFLLTPYEMSLINAYMERVVEPGRFEIMIGSSSRDIRLKGNLIINE